MNVLHPWGSPVLILGNGVAESLGSDLADVVFSGHLQGALGEMAYLIARGHRNILFVFDERSPSSKCRVHGYNMAMRNSGNESLLSRGTAERSSAAICHFTLPAELVIRDSVHSFSKGGHS